MRGRVVSLSSLLFLIAALGWSQCNFAPLYSDAFRTSALDLTIDGNDLWVANAYGVQLFDRSVDPPALVAAVAIPGITRTIVASNGRAYAGSGSSVAAIQKNGRSLQLVGSFDAGATVNDLVLTPLDLYVATGNGLLQYDTLNPNSPSRTAITFVTSSANVSSLALINSTLYAADGDATIEPFDISVPTVPQKLPTITSLPHATAVNGVNNKLFVSDGQRSEIFVVNGTTNTRVGSGDFGSSFVAPISSDAVFAAGSDRTLRALDFSVPASPVVLFQTSLPSSGGTINRIGALQIAGGRLYAAAGDPGVITFDISSFTAPFPVRAYNSGSGASVITIGGKFYVGSTSAGISEFQQSANGQLTPARNWDLTRVDIVQDGVAGFLLTSSGATLTEWTLNSTIPAAFANVTFKQPVTAAVLVGQTAYAILADQSIWSADMSQVAPTPQAVTLTGLSGLAPSAMTRSGQAIVLAGANSDGTTTLAYFAGGNLSQAPVTANVAGVATSGVALSGSTAAVFTFRGISLVDFSANSISVLPQSTAVIATGLAINNNTLFELTEGSLLVWNLGTKTLTRTFALPSDAVALGISTDPAFPLADVATVDGVAAVAYNATSHQPTTIASATANVYYKKLAIGAGRAILADATSIDIYSLATAAPHFVTSVATPGILDVAATGDAATGTIAVLANSGAITLFSPAGVTLAQGSIPASSDAVPLSIAAVNGAYWVSVSTGCLSSGGCTKQTFVFDRNGNLTRTLNGGATEVAVSGTTAAAIFDLPAEIRVYDVSDPAHPSALVTRATEGSTPPVSISLNGGSVYVAGEKLYVYAASDLAKTSEPLGSYVADPTGTVAYVDQRVRTSGACAIVSGRAFAPQTYALPSFSAGSSLSVPATVRGVVLQNDMLYLLTDDSLEIWTTGTVPKLPRRRSAQ